MNIIKKGIVMLLAVCMLAGVPAVNAWAADCDHANEIRYDTGQYMYNSYTHEVVLGYYTDGRPIVMNCNASTTYKIYVVHCKSCGTYLRTDYDKISTVHSIVH